MKRILIIGLICSFLVNISKSQDEPDGNIALDFNFNPAALFDAFAGPVFNAPSINARYFVASDAAIRAGLDLSFGHTKTFSMADSNYYNKTNTFGITIAPGYEKHFGSNKFSVFVGGEVPITYRTTKNEENPGGTVREVKNGNGGGWVTIGLNGVIGVDYYLSPKFYIGAEFTPGFAYTKVLEEETDGDRTDVGSNSFNFSLGASSGIRLGVRF